MHYKLAKKFHFKQYFWHDNVPEITLSCTGRRRVASEMNVVPLLDSLCLTRDLAGGKDWIKQCSLGISPEQLAWTLVAEIWNLGLRWLFSILSPCQLVNIINARQLSKIIKSSHWGKVIAREFEWKTCKLLALPQLNSQFCAVSSLFLWKIGTLEKMTVVKITQGLRQWWCWKKMTSLEGCKTGQQYLLCLL